MDAIFRFIEAVWRDKNHSKTVLRVAVGCLGDLGHCMEARAKPYFMLDWVRQFIAHCTKDKNNATKENARFAKQVRHDAQSPPAMFLTPRQVLDSLAALK